MKQLLAAFILGFALVSTASADKAMQSDFDRDIAMKMIDSSIQRFKLEEDVSIEDAIESMKLRANMLNFKLVADLPLSEQIKSMGEESRHMQILAFCDALIAKKMVEYNIIFAGFLPCRIAAVEDKDGNAWLVTTNMDMMLHAVDLPDDLKPLAKRVRDTIYSIIDAGVTGDL
ncbi:MAG: DUF302 domain-containing protein [Gammaproteobacteria bacterium]|nr:DUF302 domain-containing protein [Gammaproteobacteria bacterium]NNJ90844.1 DUF302 domain-containing protein [Gammaproteobacteria bacterium]